MKRIIVSIASIISVFMIACNENNDIVLLEDMTIEPSSVKVTIGSQQELELGFTPDYYEAKSIEWFSSDESIVSVDEAGCIKGLSEGQAVISAIVDGLMANCVVDVSKSDISSVSIEEDEIELSVSGTYQLNITATPADGDCSSLAWSSSDVKVATVDESGLVKAVNPGTATIKVLAGTASDECVINVRAVPKAGDYYYSDGTYSSSLDKSKEVVGVVFWAGDPTKNDSHLKTEHPDCTNGLAVSLVEYTTKFQSSYDKYYTTFFEKSLSFWIDNNTSGYKSILSGQAMGDNGNFMLGYNNTLALREFHNSEDNVDWTLDIVDSLDNHIENVSLPENTSGWYIPSIKELYFLTEGDYGYNVFWNPTKFGNLDAVNKSLGNIEGAEQIAKKSPKIYWSSTECLIYGVYIIETSWSSVPGGNPYISDNLARYIFAF